METLQGAETEAATNDCNVIVLHTPTPRPRRGVPLTDDEVTQLRDLLSYSRVFRAEFETIKAECPLAARALSTR